MSDVFQKDIFSSVRPGWVNGSASVAAVVGHVSEYFKDDLLPLTSVPMCSSAFELNSKNIKVSCGAENLLLKRWAKNSNKAHLNELLSLMKFLPSEELSVPSPVSFKDGCLVFHDGDNYWSLFPFIEGVYFSGIKNELEVVAENTALLTTRLQEVDGEKFSCFKDLHHLTNFELETLIKMEENRSSWVRYFGSAYAELLENNWIMVRNEWTRLREKEIFAGPVQLSHCDLHPHNFLMRNGKVAAILDFDGCKVTPVGYAVAYGALKQCRQTLVSLGDVSKAKKIGQMYIDIFNDYIPSSKEWTSDFHDLAIIETLRRLCLIFHLNLNRNDGAWNKVLPILLGHIEEANLLFHP